MLVSLDCKIGQSNNVSFKAGYGNDYENTDQKYERYDDINQINKEYTAKNNELTQRIADLNEEWLSLVQSHQNNPHLSKEEADERIGQIKKQIAALRDELEDNKDFLMHLWYDHHERT